jgi:hypothetical protein
VPGNDQQGVWSSSLLETVYSAEPQASQLAVHAGVARVDLRGDFDLVLFAIGAVRHVSKPSATSDDVRVGQDGERAARSERIATLR